MSQTVNTAPQAENDRTIFTFEKNTRETIVARLYEYRGKPLADLRTYVENKEGNLIPTRKGLSVQVLDGLAQLKTRGRCTRRRSGRHGRARARTT